MTRLAAILISYFGSIVPGILLMLFFAAFEGEPPTFVVVTSVAIFVIAAGFIRVYFAAWYARDKGRSGALGWLALFGWLGWFFLIVTPETDTNAGDVT